MKPNRIVIVGFGGLAREIAWLIRDLQSPSGNARFECVGHVISIMRTEKVMDGLLGDLAWLEKNRADWDSLAIGIGKPSDRAHVFEELSASFPDAEWPNLIHPSVLIDTSSAQIGRGSILCANVVGTVNIRIAEACLINLSCTIGHEAEIGFGTVVNPSVNISGGVRIGKRVLVGTGSQILQNLVIEDDSNVGAGAVVTKSVSQGKTVVGIPAKPIATL